MFNFSKLVAGAFDALTPNYSEIFESAKSYTLDGWRTRQLALVSASGTGSTVFPIWGLGGHAG